jgi:YcxB-like protein
MEQKSESVTLTFKHTEEEYLAAARLYFWHSKTLLVRLVIGCVLISICLLLLTVLLNFALPFWFLFVLILLVGTALYHGYIIDLPRRVFRGDPKFREEYNLTCSDAGVNLKTEHINSSINWNFYTGVLENDKFYLLIYGKNLPSFSLFPKRAFRSDQDELTFREILHRHVDPKFKLSACDRETYVPPALEPPDWR